MDFSQKTLALLITATLAGCGGSDSSDNNSSTPATKPSPAGTQVKVYKTVDNCAVKADVPNCHFEKGIYVLKVGKNTTDAQQQRVITQVNNLMAWAHEDVRKQFANKRIVLGLMGVDELETSKGEFVLALNEQKQKGLTVDGIELVYTPNEDKKDETTRLTTYQKLLQVYDYYVDGNNNSAPGAELTAAYSQFKTALKAVKVSADANKLEYLTFDECNYGNQQLGADRALGTPNPCTVIDEDTKKPTSTVDGKDISNGKPDMTHTVKLNLNPGALLGSVYEYKIDPSKNEVPFSKGFVDEGKLASGKPDGLTDPKKVMNSWATPALKPLDDYLNKWFFVNKK
ncbi:hypothetical protein A3K86_01210 [Photobacterium jeanii]|uniref:Uncharacterized protein n=1 Tax=Photobacterium jeanii TaxID=858640 RepID=A0A178KQG8_9GAMM|nr:hypothetical protein [Photobacterium jeanii]OAN19024.1 hypothetical protein A3K86_01210 [Photobacterium jeanii]PST87687.1 histidine ammonia-lyase [Photobacterium jeanii]